MIYIINCLQKLLKLSCLLSQESLATNTKLDGVGPVNNRHSTNTLNHFVEKDRKKIKEEKSCDTWHLKPDTWYLTCNTWHMTPDTWRLTRDTWHVRFGGGWIFSQNLSCNLSVVENYQRGFDTSRSSQKIRGLSELWNCLRQF